VYNLCYDTNNRLIEVSQTANNTERLLARYGYDPFNRRIWKEQYTDKDGQALTQARRTYFLHSDEGLIGEETQNITLNEDGSTTANGQPEITTQYGPRPDSHFTTGILFIKTKNSNNEDTFAYYHHDHLNTPIQATDKDGNIVWSAVYNAFGRATMTTPQATQDRPTITSNLRLPGQYEDTETGLYYNWNRYYSPDEGRYVTSDPIGLEGGINPYLYVGANPLGYYDPTGLDWAPPSLPQGFVDFFSGMGDGILATMSLGFVNGQSMRDFFNINGGVNRCSDAYTGGRVTGTVLTMFAFMRGARPSSLTHYTTSEEVAASIAQSGIRPSRGGFFGGGRYASSTGPFPNNIFVPPGSKIPVNIPNTSGYLRVFPGTFLQPTVGGYMQIGAMAAGYAFWANYLNPFQPSEDCGCE
jgi:RHS repeat-associated protein